MCAAPEDVACSPWFYVPRPIVGARVRLICFHHAGGSATFFHPWTTRLPGDVELVGIQLPGRTSRIAEPPFTRAEPLLDELVPLVRPWLDRPCVFFGHSMGAMLAFEVVRRLRERGGPVPRRLVVSGARAPHLGPRVDRIRHLPEREFIEALRAYEGLPDEIFRERELLDLVLPVMRADFALIESWKHVPGEPLEIPILAVGGLTDPLVPHADVVSWASHTKDECATQFFAGGHFYLRDDAAPLLSRLAREMALNP